MTYRDKPLTSKKLKTHWYEYINYTRQTVHSGRSYGTDGGQNEEWI